MLFNGVMIVETAGHGGRGFMRCSMPQLSELFTEETPLENFESAIQNLMA